MSSSPPAGVSPVRVAARRPGSRLAAGPGNGPGRSPASEALAGGTTERSVASSEVCRVVSGPACKGGEKGKRSAPARKNLAQRDGVAADLGGKDVGEEEEERAPLRTSAVVLVVGQPGRRREPVRGGSGTALRDCAELLMLEHLVREAVRERGPDDVRLADRFEVGRKAMRAPAPPRPGGPTQRAPAARAADGAGRASGSGRPPASLTPRWSRSTRAFPARPRASARGRDGRRRPGR